MHRKERNECGCGKEEIPASKMIKSSTNKLIDEPVHLLTVYQAGRLSIRLTSSIKSIIASNNKGIFQIL